MALPYAEWDCHLCTYTNQPLQLICLQCTTPRQATLTNTVDVGVTTHDADDQGDWRSAVFIFSEIIFSYYYMKGEEIKII